MDRSAERDPRLVEKGDDFRRAGLLHRVSAPDGPGPHPTVVMLHGRAGNEDVMWIFARALAPEWLLVAPRAIKEDPAGGYSWRVREQDEWPTLVQFDVAVGAVVDFIHALPELYGADLDHVYLMGFSQGAATSYAVAMRHPHLVQGIAGLVGFVPMECDDVMAAEPLEEMPIFMAVGKEDERIPYSRSLACAHTLQMVGADLDYHEYEMGHRMNAEAMRDLEAWWRSREAEIGIR
ncbi:MAG: alpha/beta fold hydrolase [Candidatus Promineifilaceae bacterium]|nr:alpha/beta fold hydrolase [Candidatus Promineifilaceae bacterium]